MFWPSGRTLRAPPPPRAIAAHPEVKGPFDDAICASPGFRGYPDGPLENPRGTGERAAAADSGPSLWLRYAFSRLRGAVRLLWARTSSAPVFCGAAVNDNERKNVRAGVDRLNLVALRADEKVTSSFPPTRVGGRNPGGQSRAARGA